MRQHVVVRPDNQRDAILQLVAEKLAERGENR
jgi:hypothetical protein